MPSDEARAVRRLRRSALVVDDEEGIRNSLARLLGTAGWRVSTAADARSCLGSYDGDRPDVVLLDIGLPGVDGLQLLQMLRERDADASVVMLTGQHDVALAVKAMRLGAENFLEKPPETLHLEAALDRAYENAELRRKARYFSDQASSPCSLLSVDTSPRMRDVARYIERFAAGSAPVLLTGETGSGKGWIGRLIHQHSARAAAPLVEVNCGGLSATFLDSELFGHEKGAFTDAKGQKRGLFEVANHGTLFLDEIGDLAPALQPKLLKVLEDQRFRRLGGTQEVEVDVRLIAATHHDLTREVAEGRFREDLYYRLAILPLHVPPLRERGADSIIVLAGDLLRLLRQRIGQGPTRIAPDALRLLSRYAWPGNVRELRNVLERVLLVAAGEQEIRGQHLPVEIQDTPAPLDEPGLDGDLTLAAAIDRHIARVVAQCGGNRTLAARALRISRATLYARLSRSGSAIA